MDEQQQEDLQKALSTLEPPAETIPSPEAKTEAPVEAPPEPPKEPEAVAEPDDPTAAYQKKLEAIMAEQRAKFEETQKSQRPDPQVEHLRRIEEALKAQQSAERPPTLGELLGQADDDKPDYVKKLEEKIAVYDKKLEEWEKNRKEFQQQQEVQQRQAWEQTEQTQISKFIEQEAESFPYVAALRPMNSDADLYNGMITMYNQGYSPSYKDMADLVETRIEGVLNHLVGTAKFKSWLQKRLGVQIDSAPQTGATLTGSDGVETPNAVDPSQLTEEESLRLALKAAKEAAAAASRR